MCPALGQRHHPGLRERGALTFVDSGSTEEPVVHSRVSNIQCGAFDCHQPTASQKRPRRCRCRQRLRNPIEQSLQRLGTQTTSGLKDRRLRRQLHRAHRTRLHPRKPVGHQRNDVLIRTLRVQSHTHREVRQRCQDTRQYQGRPPAQVPDRSRPELGLPWLRLGNRFCRQWRPGSNGGAHNCAS